MGCFNKIGFISHLPITEGDDIVFFICADLFGFHTDETPISPGTMSPLFLPIKGKYNDYGGIDDICHDDNVAYIESLFGISIQRLIDAIHRNGGHPLEYMEKELSDDKLEMFKTINDDYRNALKVLCEHISFYSIDSKKLYLCTTMEHLSVYELISSKYKWEDFTQVYDEVITDLVGMDCLTKVNIFDAHHSTFGMRKEFDALAQQMQEGKELNEKKVKSAIESSLNEIKITCALAKIESRSPFRDTWVGLKGYNCGGFNWEVNKNAVIECSSFVRGMILLGLCFQSSTYGNQDIGKGLGNLKTIYEHYLQKIEEKTQKYLEY